jgi:hypothetical protein
MSKNPFCTPINASIVCSPMSARYWGMMNSDGLDACSCAMSSSKWFPVKIIHTDAQSVLIQIKSGYGDMPT